MESDAHLPGSTPPSTAKSLVERRGKRPMQLFVANRGDASSQSEQISFIQRRTPPELVQWQSGRSTPLPPYTSHIDSPRPDCSVDEHFLEDTKQSRVILYVAQQWKAHRAVKEASNQQGKAPTALPKELPPYLSCSELSSSQGETTEDLLPIACPGLRPLILPTQIAKWSAQYGSPQKREPPLRPLLLPQDLEERSQYEVTARVVFRTERDSASSSASTCMPGAHPSTSYTATSGKIESILALLDGSGVMHSTPISKAIVQTFPCASLGNIHGSVASLASTYGTTPSCSSAFLSQRSYGSLLLVQTEDCQTDWEDDVISEYCN